MVNIKKILISPIVIRVLTVGLNFVSNVIINRSLGLELKGQYTTILNYANFLQLFLNLGICYAYPMLKKEKELHHVYHTDHIKINYYGTRPITPLNSMEASL